MLLAIREKVQGWIAWTIVAILIVPFALWGIDQYSSGNRAVTVAKVNGYSISDGEFLQAYNRHKLRLQQQFGEMYDQVVEDQALRDQVLESLIESNLINQWASEKGLLISNNQLSSLIQSAEVFQENGKFSQAVYQDILMRNNFSVAEFEYDQRKFLLEKQFNNLTSGSKLIFNNEGDLLVNLQNQQRNIDYLRVDHSTFAKDIKISDEQIEAYYQANLDEYLVPQKVTVDFIEFSLAQIANEIDVTEEEAQNYYDDNLGMFTEPELRRASHILVAHNDSELDEKIALIQSKLAEGEDFAELAKEYSIDTGSALNGGDLDFFERGMMVEDFDQAVFAMEVGEISEPIITEFGVHIIKLTAIKAQETPEFDKIKQGVIAQMKTEKTQQIYQNKLEELASIAYEQPDSLEPLLEVIKTSIQTSEEFSVHGTRSGSFANPKVLEAVFSDDVFKSNLNSSVIELNDETAMVLRINQVSPEKQLALAEVVDEIKAELVEQEAINKASEVASKLLVSVKEGEKPHLIQQDGVEWHKVGWIDRNNQQLQPEITQAAFKVAKPVDETANWQKVRMLTGDTVLIRLNNVQLKELAEKDAELQVEQFSAYMASVFQNAELEARLASLKAGAKIEKRKIYQTIK